MTLTNKQWTFLSIVTVALLILVVILGGVYRLFYIVLFPLCLWLSLRHEPDQKRVRPGIRVLGWIFVCIATLAVVGAVISLLAGR
jgi:hypothetical protein